MSLKNIVITGASSGIGAATARRFADKNNRLILIARRKDRLKALRKELEPYDVSIVELDVTSREDVEKAFLNIDQEYGGVDILVNNAGGAFGLSPAYEANMDDWENCVDVNINGLIYCTHSVLAGMVKRNKGHIFNIGSVAGHYPYPGGNVYGGVKAFVYQFSLNLRADLIGTAVRVSCIEPGIVGDTEFSLVRFKGDKAKADSVYERTKPLVPQDIAEVIHYCAMLPPHINVNTMELMPVSQAFSPLAVHRE